MDEQAAKNRGATPAQVALAWVLAQGQDIIPIPGTKRRKYLEENLASLQVSLTSEDLLSLGLAAPAGQTAGTRYPESMMKSVDG